MRTLSRKFIGKYMRQAKQLGEDENPCHSRKLGVLLVKVYEDGDSHIVGTGYNGPPKRTPHCDTKEYLEHIVWPQLNLIERQKACESVGVTWTEFHAANRDEFLKVADGCKRCPRRLIGAPTGERLELCSCEHAEKNAIANATEDLHGCTAFCWCGVACWDCAKLMINAGIRRAYFVDDGSYARNGGADYSFGTRKLFQWADVEIVVEKPEFYLAPTS